MAGTISMRWWPVLNVPRNFSPEVLKMEDIKSEDAPDTATGMLADAPPAPALTEGGRIVPNVSDAILTEEVARITGDLIGALKTVYDPEIPVDIYELGLIYKV